MRAVGGGVRVLELAVRASGSAKRISFVGSHAGGHTSTSAVTVNFSSLLNEAGVAPTLLENDIVFVQYSLNGTTDRSQAQCTPTGYTAAHTDRYANGSAHDINLQVSWKKMGAVPDTSVDIPASSGATRAVTYTITVLRGVDTTTPIDVAAVGGATGATQQAPDIPAITPITTGAWILGFGTIATGTTAASMTNPANMSSTTNYFRTGTQNATGACACAVAIYTGWTSGAFDPDAFGGDANPVDGSRATVGLAIRPAS